MTRKRSTFPPVPKSAAAATIPQIQGVLGGVSRSTVWRLFACKALPKVAITPHVAGTPVAALRKYAKKRGFPF